jgi:hypothetical protein
VMLIADTGYELYAACGTVRELGQLYSELGMADGTPDGAMHRVCDPIRPQDQSHVRTTVERREAQEVALIACM